MLIDTAVKNNVLNSSWIQLATLAASVAVFFFIPLMWRKAEQRLPAVALTDYRKLSRDVYVQVLLRVGIPVAVAGMGLANGNLAEAVTNAYLGISLTGGATAMWTVRKAHVSYTKAVEASVTGARGIRLGNVHTRNLGAFDAALAATIIGALGLIVVNSKLVEIQSWFWFASFLCTALPLYAQSWSLSVQFAASKYEQNPKLGVQRLRR